MNFNISNALVEYTPSLPVNTQKLLMIIMGNTTKEDFIEAMKNKSSVNVKINKTDLFQIF